MRIFQTINNLVQKIKDLLFKRLYKHDYYDDSLIILIMDILDLFDVLNDDRIDLNTKLFVIDLVLTELNRRAGFIVECEHDLKINPNKKFKFFNDFINDHDISIRDKELINQIIYLLFSDDYNNLVKIKTILKEKLNHGKEKDNN